MSRTEMIAKLIKLTGDESWRHTSAAYWELAMALEMVEQSHNSTVAA